VQRLTRFRLRSKVTIRAAEEWHVYAAWDAEPRLVASAAPPQSIPIVAADPRLPEAGWRVLSRDELPANAGEAEWDRHRLGLGLPDGTRDLEVEKAVLLEAGFDELHGVSWSKGCYMGQELTARTKYRGLVKRRLVPVAVEGLLPQPGTPVLHDGIEVGAMRSGRDEIGLAVLRLDRLGTGLTCGEAGLIARVPGWMRLPERVT
jgi:folate-binding protein YgfZ